MPRTTAMRWLRASPALTLLYAAVLVASGSIRPARSEGHASLSSGSDDVPAAIPLRYPVGWYAPFWSGSGYSSEAINYVLSMVRSGSVRTTDLWLAHHGDQWRKEVHDGMAEEDRKQLSQLEGSVNKSKPAIIVCHSLPTNWRMLPSPMGWAGDQCPPDPRDYAYSYLIGRTMFETDRLPASFVPRCNAMNEIWVPSDFSKEVFIASGVHPSKLRVVPEGINATYWDPDRHTPINMPQGELVFGVADPNAQPYPHAKREHGSSRSPSQQPWRRPVIVGQRPPYYPDKTATVRVTRAPAPKHRAETETDGQPSENGGRGGTTKRRRRLPELLQQESMRGKPSHGHGSQDDVEAPLRQGSGTARDDYLRPGAPQDDAVRQGSGEPSAQALRQSREPGGHTLDSDGAREGAVEEEDVSYDNVAWEEEAREEDESDDLEDGQPFRFLSSFKWEARKGWDVLLEAYLSEFTGQENVELTIITKPFVGGTDYKRQMHAWAERAARARYDKERAAAVQALATQQAQQQQQQAERQQQQQQDAAAAAAQVPSEDGQSASSHSGSSSSTSHSSSHGSSAGAAAELPLQAASASGSGSSPAALFTPSWYAVMGIQPPVTATQIPTVVTAAPTPTAAATTTDTPGLPTSGTSTTGTPGSPTPGSPTTPAGVSMPEEPPPFVFNASTLPRLYVVHHHISDADLPRFYKAVDAFVLPSRGEGWGRPHVEAMSMGLPVISTNWSGITAYLDEEVGYPIKVDGLVPADLAVWWFRGLNWAQPSVTHLRALMRDVYTNRREARRRGAAARLRMVERYGPEPIGRLMAKEFQRVNALLNSLE